MENMGRAMLQDLRDLWEAVAVLALAAAAITAQWVFLATIVATIAKWPETPTNVLWLLGSSVAAYVTLTVIFHLLYSYNKKR